MSARPTLSIEDSRLLRGGREHRVVSGAIHYFRVHPELWLDRLTRIRAMGCNTVELYVAWNFHQPAAASAADFTGWRDVAGFVRLADSLGLDVIVRPGPYICAEWDFGGLPAWLLADENLRIRTMDPAYLAAVDRWFDQLLPELVPLLATNGGPVVAVQVENEYGSWGNDLEYLAYVRDGLLARGVDVLLFTSDGPQPRMLAGGTLPGVWATTNFGSRPQESFATFRELRPTDPLFCMEFWNGWFDHTGEPHHTRDPADAAAALDGILAAGASVNVYMAHGGTNFGFWAGANHGGGHELTAEYQPTVTSYDYDAPIGEAGELTEKFHAFRDVIARHVPGSDLADLPAPLPRVAPQTVTTASVAALRDVLDLLSAPPVRCPLPEPMEKLGHAFGLVHYRHRLTGPPGPTVLRLPGVRDHAQVFVDGRPAGTVSRADPDPCVPIEVPEGGADLEILVEPYGRVNYGPRMIDRKGLIEPPRLDHQFLHGWEVRVLPLADPSSLPPVPVPPASGPVFHRAAVALDAAADAFVAVPGSGRCLVWLNGFLLGRLDSRGPAVTLYAPGPLWRPGLNDIVVLTLAGDHTPPTVELRDRPDLGPLAPPPVY